MQLPTWTTCKERVEMGNPSALEQFIYDNQPCGFELGKKFRKQLQAVIKEVADATTDGHL